VHVSTVSGSLKATFACCGGHQSQTQEEASEFISLLLLSGIKFSKAK
jgi:hypothetical protein